MANQPRQADEPTNPFPEAAAAIRKFSRLSSPGGWLRITGLVRLFSRTLGPRWLRGIMGTAFVLALAVAIINTFTFCTIVGRGRRRGQNQLWVWRKMHGADYDPPYYIPNGQLFSVIFGTAAAVAMAVSACGFAFVPPGLVWTSNIPVLFTTFGSWMVAADAWAALWGVAFTKPTTRMTRVARHPYFINAVCWGWPTMVLLVELGVLIWMAIRHERLRHVGTLLVDLLDEAALEYEGGGMAAVTVLGPINDAETQLSVTSRALLYAMRVTTCVSAAFSIVTVLLFAFALVLVRRAYRNFVRLSKPTFSALGAGSRAGTTRSRLSISIILCKRPADDSNPSAVQQSASTAPERAQMAVMARYRRLLLSLGIMAVAVAADAATALTTAFYLTAVHLYLSATRYSVYMGLTVLIFIPHFFPDSVLAFLSLMRVIPLWRRAEAPDAGTERAPAPGRHRNVGLFDSFEAPGPRDSVTSAQTQQDKDDGTSAYQTQGVPLHHLEKGHSDGDEPTS